MFKIAMSTDKDNTVTVGIADKEFRFQTDETQRGFQKNKSYQDEFTFDNY